MQNWVFFLCSLDDLLKNVIVLFFGNQISTREKLQKFLQHISHIHTRIFYLTNFEKKIRIYQIQFLFGMSPGVDSYSRHFETINK